MSVIMRLHRSGSGTSVPTLALVGLLALGSVSGCANEVASGADPDRGSTAPAGVSPSSGATGDPASSAASSPTGSVDAVKGFVGFDDFPMRFDAPSGAEDVSEGVGTRSVAVSGVRPTAVLVDSVSSTPAADLPADLAGFISQARPNAMVSEVRAREVSGLAAQSFTLTQRRGTNPSDLWCARDGYCFKLLTNKPMDMTAVRTPEGLVLFTIEYHPEERVHSRAVMEQVLSTVRWE